MLIATLERINALSAEVYRLDGEDAAALERLLRQIEAAADALMAAASSAIVVGEWPATAPVAEEAGRSFVLPLGRPDQPFGALTVTLPERRELQRSEQVLLQALANVAAIALSQAGVRLASQRTLARKEDELALLRRAGLLISSRTGLQDTLDTILEMALEVTRRALRHLSPRGPVSQRACHRRNRGR